MLTEFAITPRKTVSNPILVAKNAQTIVPRKKERTRKDKELEPIVPKDSESEHAVGRMEEEDYNAEQEAATLSPMKGNETRGTALVRPAVYDVQKPDAFPHSH